MSMSGHGEKDLRVRMHMLCCESDRWHSVILPVNRFPRTILYNVKKLEMNDHLPMCLVKENELQLQVITTGPT